MNDTEKRINKMLKKSEVILNAGKQTNEEYLKSCTTEQLIELFEKITDPKVGYLVGYWEWWLKQPHKPKE